MERAWKLHRVIPSENVESEELSVKIIAALHTFLQVKFSQSPGSGAPMVKGSELPET